MSYDDYQKLAMRTNGQTDEQAMLDMCLLGLSGEVGELNDLLKKLLFHNHPQELEKICLECGDVMWYVALACEYFQWSLDELLENKEYMISFHRGKKPREKLLRACLCMSVEVGQIAGYSLRATSPQALRLLGSNVFLHVRRLCQYLVLFCETLGLHFDEVLDKNIEKLSKRYQVSSKASLERVM